ncbi:MAG: hypothetical protein Q9191_008247, partial [Dirinaria sp. TL-2023a]
MAAAGADFGDLERNRLLLEGNVARLRKSLQYWQTWEAEYEGMKEEILALGEDCAEEGLAHVANEFDGELLNQKDVQENVKSVSKQIQKAEQQLAAAEIIAQADFGDKEGLPLTEIREELDDEGNVISSSATRAGDTAPQILETLRKAGIKDVPKTSEDAPLKSNLRTSRVEEINDDKDDSEASGVSEEPKIGQGEEEAAAIEPSGQAPKTSSESDKGRHLGRKKSVSFAEGTKTEDSTVSRKRLPHPLFAKPKSRVTGSAPKVETIAE